MAKVYISQSTRHPLAKAEMFGELVVLNFGDIAPGHNMDDSADLMTHASEIMYGGYDPEEDHILLTGNPVLIGWVLHIAFEIAEKRGAKSISWLYWDRRDQFYAPCRVPVPEITVT